MHRLNLCKEYTILTEVSHFFYSRNMSNNAIDRCVVRLD